MKLNFCILSIIFPILILAIDQKVNAQPGNYTEYSGNFVGMNVKYPNNWLYQEYNGNIFSNDDYTTVFVPPSEVSFQSNLTASTPDINADAYVQIAKQRDLPYKNMPLDLYLDYAQKFQESMGNDVSNATKINLTDGTPAYEYGLLYGDDQKGYTVIMNKRPESYYFMYVATPEKFNTYLPIAKQMLKTLSINSIP